MLNTILRILIGGGFVAYRLQIDESVRETAIRSLDFSRLELGQTYMVVACRHHIDAFILFSH